MNIAKRIDQYDRDNVYFCDSIKNNVMLNGNFIRILYCTHHFTLNGIYIQFSLKDVCYEKYYQKYKCVFDGDKYQDIMSGIVDIENSIIKKSAFMFPGKNPQFKIAEQLHHGFIKIFLSDMPKSSNTTFLLKISGIWETDDEYGVTYKFSVIHPGT